MTDSKKLFINEIFVLTWNLLIAMISYMICRFIYWAENYSSFTNISFDQWTQIIIGGLKFDLSAVLYTNILLIVLLSIPIHTKYKLSALIGKILFLLFNGIGILMNLSDAVYYKFTGRRTTASVFHEFAGEDNLGSIFGVEIIRHWYLVLSAFILLFLLYKLYKAPQYKNCEAVQLKYYYPIRTLLFILIIYLTVNGMRGGFGAAVRPITISNANQYVSKPSEAALVLNTPFSILRTINNKAFVTPSYFTQEEMEQIYTPVHTPNDSLSFRPKNIVVLIIESFGKEYIGSLNKDLEPAYNGYTPFTDSLVSRSLTFRYSYSNGRKSIDGMPSILSSIPMFVEPFFLTDASLNDVSGLAKELSSKGYYSAFFHGAQNGSMGFQAFARSTGFQDYFGRTEYNEDNRFDGDKDFDGTWAIWDEPFLQFYAQKMSEMKEPFITALFTASSHHPFVIPSQYKDTFPEGSLIIHKCIRYTDHALRKFFETASQQEWYKNTLFVLTADHTNLTDHAFYQTDLGKFCVPIILFDPSGETPTGIKDIIAQQTDIMPTLLGLLNYDKPYVAFGCDLLNTPADDLYAVHYNNDIYQYVKQNHLLQFDGEKTIGFYTLSDSILQNNILNQTTLQNTMERELKAIIQQYMMRMNENQLTIK